MFLADIFEDMELTVGEIAYRLSTEKKPVSSDAVRKRLARHGYEPVRFIGANSMFELSDDDIEYLKQLDKRGPGPKAEAASEPASKGKTATRSKTTKPKKS
jgi:hypothetical protein